MTTKFYEQLKIGNKKENYVCNVLNICGIPTNLNNLEDVTDIDLTLPAHEIIMDVKFLNTPFNNSKSYVDIDPENCILINVNHVRRYYEKEQRDKLQSFVCFLIKYDLYNVNEIKFIPVSYLIYLIDSGKGKIRNGKLHLSRNECHDMRWFLNYCNNKDSIKPKRYCFR